MSLRPHRLPAWLRGAAYAFAVAVLLFLTLAPATDLPKVTLWDKAEHGLAWFVLAGVGLAFWPSRPGRVAGFALFLGVLVEILQASMGFGRDADWRDVVGDSVGIATALAVWAAVRWVAPPLIPAKAGTQMKRAVRSAEGDPAK